MDLASIKQLLLQRLDSLAIRCKAWIERFIWLLILARGGLILLPILLVVGLFTDPALVLRFLLVALVIAPGSGFVGGLLYGIMSPLAGRLGIIGAVLKFSVAAAVYLFVLVVAIVPVLDGKNTFVVPDSSDWWFIGLVAILMGIVLTYNDRRDAA